MKLHSYKEDFLEAVYVLLQKNGSVHLSDVAESLDASASDVCQAAARLQQDGDLTADRSGALHLTSAGKKKALEMQEQRFFEELLYSSVRPVPVAGG
ncbi:MAG: metal-dependent transcriptional regulator [Eubacteriales bacterium]|nr:metal-dependent transcriptional regulator [Eubacteriales bacterium]